MAKRLNAFLPIARWAVICLAGVILIISIIGLFLFAGLTVYDTQKLKNLYWDIAGSEFMGKAVIMGALTLYLDFINLFLFLLRFMGDRR